MASPAIQYKRMAWKYSKGCKPMVLLSRAFGRGIASRAAKDTDSQFGHEGEK
jgi:hypothetical protein